MFGVIESSCISQVSVMMQHDLVEVVLKGDLYMFNYTQMLDFELKKIPAPSPLPDEGNWQTYPI